MSDLSNKTIWLTGASSGIGFALLNFLLQKNASVIVTGRNIQKFQLLEKQYPQQLQSIYCDFSKQDAVSAIKNELYARATSLDYVILNAGVCEYIDVNDTDVDAYRRVMQVNFLAVTECVALALPLLRKAPSKPQIIFISSLVTELPFTRSEAYGASKSALNYFANSLRIDLRNEIDVSIVQPGFVDTPLTQKNDFPMPFLIDSETAAKKIMSVMESRAKAYAFPFRFSLILKLLSISPALWHRISQGMLVRK